MHFCGRKDASVNFSGQKEIRNENFIILSMNLISHRVVFILIQ